MSQSEPQFRNPKNAYTLPIDEVGELARFRVAGGTNFDKYSTDSLIELRIDGDAPASYTVEFGVEDEDGETIHWNEVPDDYSYASTATVEDTWRQARDYVRIMVTEAAPADSEARVSLVQGV